MGPALEFLVQPFEHVGRLHMFVVRQRQTIIRSASPRCCPRPSCIVGDIWLATALDLTIDVRGVDRGPTSSGSNRFAIDSPLEEVGFEPPVPLAKRVGHSGRNGKCRRGEKGCLESLVYPAGDRGFESHFLQRGVYCEPVRSGGIQPGDPLRGSTCPAPHRPERQLDADPRRLRWYAFLMQSRERHTYAVRSGTRGEFRSAKSFCSCGRVRVKA
jgi:hypothetical protein